jgi:HK97 family phage major capsid protein
MDGPALGKIPVTKDEARALGIRRVDAAALADYDRRRATGEPGYDPALMPALLRRIADGPSRADVVAQRDVVRRQDRSLRAIAPVLSRQDAAFAKYLRTGRTSTALGNVSRRDLSEGAVGAYVVAPAFNSDLLLSLKYASAFLAAGTATWESKTGAPATQPIVNDLSTSAVAIAENTGGSEADITVAKITWGQTPLWTSGIVRAGRGFVEDAEVDLQGFLTEAFAARMARLMDSTFAATLLSGLTQTYTTAANTAVTWNDLVGAFYKLDPAYRGASTCAWIMSPSFAAYLREVTDTAGRPVLLDYRPQTFTDNDLGGTGRQMSTTTLLGKPVFESTNIPGFAAGAKVCVLADWSHAAVVRVAERAEVVVLTERYADSGEYGYIGFGRYDCQPANLDAAVVLTVHA